eukprot:jgi/Mesvir1/16407/Mv18142-RA.2
MGDVWAGLAGGRSLQEWLKSSPYPTGADHAAGRRCKRKKSKGSQRGEKQHAAGVAPGGLSDDGGYPPYRGMNQVVGKRRLRRWANEYLLVQMGGAMDARAMASLFAPPPFGESYPSPLEQLLANASPALWDRLREADMDKEPKMLRKHASSAHGAAPHGRPAPTSVRTAASDALPSSAARKQGGAPADTSSVQACARAACQVPARYVSSSADGAPHGEGPSPQEGGVGAPRTGADASSSDAGGDGDGDGDGDGSGEAARWHQQREERAALCTARWQALPRASKDALRRAAHRPLVAMLEVRGGSRAL